MSTTNNKPTFKPATTSVPIHELISARWSPRAFDPKAQVEREKITALVEAARWAPSCFGDEPWRFLVCDRFADEAAWQKAFDCLMEGNQIWVKDAPVIVAVVVSLNFRYNGSPNRWSHYDSGAAAENLCLQATASGLHSHQMGGFREKDVVESFGIPDGFDPISMIAIGYAGDPTSLSDELQEKEADARGRMEIGQIAFEGHWEKPIA